MREDCENFAQHLGTLGTPWGIENGNELYKNVAFADQGLL